MTVVSGFELFGSGGLIKSIQRGEGSFGSSGIAQNIAINHVNPQKSIVLTRFWASFLSPPSVAVLGNVTSNTNLIIDRGGSGSPVDFLWEVIEFDESVNIQTGQVIDITTDTEIDINPVNLERALIFYSWRTTASSGNAITPRAIRFVSESKIQILASENRTVRWYVVELPS